jgi:hypothetical protein
MHARERRRLYHLLLIVNCYYIIIILLLYYYYIIIICYFVPRAVNGKRMAGSVEAGGEWQVSGRQRAIYYNNYYYNYIIIIIIIVIIIIRMAGRRAILPRGLGQLRQLKLRRCSSQHRRSWRCGFTPRGDVCMNRQDGAEYT